MKMPQSLRLVIYLGLATSYAIPKSPASVLSYDVMVIGGGPSGLSALSGLVRVQRNAIMFDSGVYRNAQTRYMHDVIGNDGTDPAKFRGKARAQVLKYPGATIKNTTIVDITSIDNGTAFEATDSAGRRFTSRKVVLATGLLDIMPTTPGVAEAFGKGIFWCPWCDGFEHRNQPLGIIGPLSSAYGSALEVMELNTDTIIFSDGTDIPHDASTLDTKYPAWRSELEALGVTIDNRTIKSITRLQDGGFIHDSLERVEYDMFQVNFFEGQPVQRNAFMANLPAKQNSNLGSKLGTYLDGISMAVDKSMRTSISGVFAVGDANNDDSTNIPHAMWSGKRAAVNIHMELAHEDVTGKVGPRSDVLRKEKIEAIIGNELENLHESLL